MAPVMWYEAEIAYRRERIAADFARGRRAPREQSTSEVGETGRNLWPALRRLGRGMHVTSG